MFYLSEKNLLLESKLFSHFVQLIFTVAEVSSFTLLSFALSSGSVTVEVVLPALSLFGSVTRPSVAGLALRSCLAFQLNNGADIMAQVLLQRTSGACP